MNTDRYHDELGRPIDPPPAPRPIPQPREPLRPSSPEQQYRRAARQAADEYKQARRQHELNSRANQPADPPVEKVALHTPYGSGPESRPDPATAPAPPTKDMEAETRSDACLKREAEALRRKTARRAAKQRELTELAQKLQDDVTARVANKIARAQEEARQAERDGVPAATAIVKKAALYGLERELYREAQAIRAPWQLATWTTDQRKHLDQHINLTNEAKAKKGTRK